jgi:hypothetical protein
MVMTGAPAKASGTCSSSMGRGLRAYVMPDDDESILYVYDIE